MKSIVLLISFITLALNSFAQQEERNFKSILEKSAKRSKVAYTLPNDYTFDCSKPSGSDSKALYGLFAVSDCIFISPDSLLAFGVKIYGYDKDYIGLRLRDSIMHFQLDSIRLRTINAEGEFFSKKFLKKFNANGGFYAKFEPSPKFYKRDVYNQIIMYEISHYQFGEIGVHFLVNKANIEDPKKKKKIEKEMKKILSGFKFYME
ncbi:hypothetical protein [Sphingobacterium bovisgrunnientis]|uniref:hypothetical protein n=1 Tax=Sphingobacterium bovisgrunnientis TaxID=1874697 RepID=UPI00135CCF3F|nr:hypothetical protein [Sphingobacterium bovisgrunnientis]